MGRSRSSPHQRGNTPAGSEDPSWLPCPHSQACGSQRPSTRSLAQPSSTENALRRRKTLSAQPQSSISKDRCSSEELGENTDRFGTTHKDFPPNQKEDLNSLRKLAFLTKSQYGMICGRILDILCIYMYISNCIFGNTFHIVKWKH